jgi:hypothetical protein
MSEQLCAGRIKQQVPVVLNTDPADPPLSRCGTANFSWRPEMRVFKLFILSALLATGIAVGAPSEKAHAACLEFNDNGENAWWQNTCGFTVSVNWTSSSSVCSGWSCSDTISGHGHSSINQGQGHVNWRECRGSSCTPSCADARSC